MSAKIVEFVSDFPSHGWPRELLRETDPVRRERIIAEAIAQARVAVPDVALAPCLAADLIEKRRYEAARRVLAPLYRPWVWSTYSPEVTAAIRAAALSRVLVRHYAHARRLLLPALRAYEGRTRERWGIEEFRHECTASGVIVTGYRHTYNRHSGSPYQFNNWDGHDEPDTITFEPVSRAELVLVPADTEEGWAVMEIALPDLERTLHVPDLPAPEEREEELPGEREAREQEERRERLFCIMLALAPSALMTAGIQPGSPGFDEEARDVASLYVYGWRGWPGPARERILRIIRTWEEAGCPVLQTVTDHQS